jgi:hypothetical protein
VILNSKMHTVPESAHRFPLLQFTPPFSEVNGLIDCWLPDNAVNQAARYCGDGLFRGQPPARCLSILVTNMPQLVDTCWAAKRRRSQMRSLPPLAIY